jgi:hypothetical protein
MRLGSSPEKRTLACWHPTLTVGCAVVVAGGEDGDAAPVGTEGLVGPRPTAYIISVSPGWAGLCAVTREVPGAWKKLPLCVEPGKLAEKIAGE